MVDTLYLFEHTEQASLGQSFPTSAVQQRLTVVNEEPLRPQGRQWDLRRTQSPSWVTFCCEQPPQVTPVCCMTVIILYMCHNGKEVGEYRPKKRT